jgi:hypothetical protein
MVPDPGVKFMKFFVDTADIAEIREVSKPAFSTASPQIRP